MRRLVVVRAVTPHVPDTEIIGQDEDDVRLGGCRRFGSIDLADDGEKQREKDEDRFHRVARGDCLGHSWVAQSERITR